MKHRDALGRYQDYYYKLSVWEEVIAHLRTYVSEGGVPPEKNVASSFGSSGMVPEQVILGLIEEIASGPMGALEEELLTLEEMELSDGKKQSKTKKLKEPSKSKKTATGAGRRKPLSAVSK